MPGNVPVPFQQGARPVVGYPGPSSFVRAITDWAGLTLAGCDIQSVTGWYVPSGESRQCSLSLRREPDLHPKRMLPAESMVPAPRHYR